MAAEASAVFLSCVLRSILPQEVSRLIIFYAYIMASGRNGTMKIFAVDLDRLDAADKPRHVGFIEQLSTDPNIKRATLQDNLTSSE